MADRPCTAVEAVAWALEATVTENDAASVPVRAAQIVDHMAGDGWRVVRDDQNGGGS